MVAVLALLVVALCPAAVAAFGCGECMVVQEGIQRSILHNITALEKKATLGTSETATVQIGQIIWHMCDSAAWQGQRRYGYRHPSPPPRLSSHRFFTSFKRPIAVQCSATHRTMALLQNIAAERRGGPPPAEMRRLGW